MTSDGTICIFCSSAKELGMSAVLSVTTAMLIFTSVIRKFIFDELCMV